MSDAATVARSPRQYWCFISYKHTDNQDEGRQWASWLHQQLETYEVPEDLVGKPNLAGEPIPERIFPVFRDEEELGVGHHLTDRIYEALDNTRVLVVLCSPRVIESPYVYEEIRYFKRQGKADSIYAAIIDGDPGSRTIESGQCFPDTLTYDVDEAGNVLANAEADPPLAADFRLPDQTQGWTSRAAYRMALIAEGGLNNKETEERLRTYEESRELAKLKLIAGILNVHPGELQKRDKAYQLEKARRNAARLRRTVAIVSMVSIAAIIAFVFAWLQRQEAVEQTAVARVGEGRYWLEMARQQIDMDDVATYPAADMLAARALAFENGGPTEDWLKDNGFADLEEWRGERQYPLLLDPLRAQTQHLEAKELLQRNRLDIRPTLLWSSPVSIQHTRRVSSLAWNPQKAILASSSYDRSIRIWDLETGEQIKALEGHEGIVSEVVWNPAGTLLASSSWDNTIRIWSGTTGELLRTLISQGDNGICVAWSPDGSRLLSGSQYGISQIWDTTTWDLLHMIEEAFLCVAWNPDSTTFATGSFTGSVQIWDAETAEQLRVLGDHEDRVSQVAWSPDGTLLASVGDDHTIKVWDFTSEDPISIREPWADVGDETMWIEAIAWSPDSATLAGAGHTDGIRLWNPQTGKRIRSLEGNLHWVESLAWSPDGTTISSGTTEGIIQLWDVATGVASPCPAPEQSRVSQLQWSPDGKRFASDCGDGVKIWDTPSGKLIRHLERADLENRSLNWGEVDSTLVSLPDLTKTAWSWDPATGEDLLSTIVPMETQDAIWSPDGRKVACISPKWTLIWDAHSGELLQRLDQSDGEIAWSPDSTTLASVDNDRSIRLWDPATGKSIKTIEEMENWTDVLAWSPDGTKLAAGSKDNLIRIWDVATGDRLTTLTGHSESVYHLAWSPDDGTTLASASVDLTIRLWDTSSGKALSIIQGHNSEVTKLSWSPDGSMLGSVSTLDGIKLWNIPSEAPLNSVHASLASNAFMAWSPDGSILASASNNHGIRLWDAATGTFFKLIGPNTSYDWLAWSPNGETLCCISGHTIQFWDPITGEQLAAYNKPISDYGWDAASASWSPDSTRVAIEDFKEVKIWSVDEEKNESLVFQDFIEVISWGNEGTKVACGFEDGSVEIRELSGGPANITIHAHDSAIKFLAWSPKTNTLASATYADKVSLWDTTNGDFVATLDCEGASIDFLAWYPDGVILAIANSEIRLWDSSTKKLLALIETDQALLRTCSRSPDGTRLANVGDGVIQVWSQAGDPVKTLKNPESDHLNSMMTWSPDSSRLAYGTVHSDTIQIWEDSNFLPTPPSPDYSPYWRDDSHPDGWANWNPDRREFDWFVPRIGGREFDFLTDQVPPGTAHELLVAGDALPLFKYYWKRRHWNAAWLWWGRLTDEEREEFLPSVFRSFLALSGDQPTDAPPDWYTSRTLALWSDYREQLQPQLRSYNVWRLLHFAQGIAAKPQDTGLEELALEALAAIAEINPESTYLQQPEIILTKAILLYRIGNSASAKATLDQTKDQITEPLAAAIERAKTQKRNAEAQWLQGFVEQAPPPDPPPSEEPSAATTPAPAEPEN